MLSELYLLLNSLRIGITLSLRNSFWNVLSQLSMRQTVLQSSFLWMFLLKNGLRILEEESKMDQSQFEWKVILESPLQIEQFFHLEEEALKSYEFYKKTYSYKFKISLIHNYDVVRQFLPSLYV